MTKGDRAKMVPELMKEAAQPNRGNLGFVREVCIRALDQATAAGCWSTRSAASAT
jgi:hypothetical protein